MTDKIWSRARELFADETCKVDPHKRGLYLSAARSELFNQLLAERVQDRTWNTAIPGDVFMFPDSRSFFTPEAITDELLQRLAAREIHPSGMLWGVKPSTATGPALDLENRVAERLAEMVRGLKAAGLETSRRPLRLCPEAITWDFPQPDTLALSFTLPAGAYATAVLRELVHTERFDA